MVYLFCYVKFEGVHPHEMQKRNLYNLHYTKVYNLFHIPIIITVYFMLISKINAYQKQKK